MNAKKNKLINFILEFSQVLLVFLGVYSALMCLALGLDLTTGRGICALITLLSSILFYGLFTVLETFRNGKLYGLLGIAAFFVLIIFRFFSTVQKGCITIANSFLKQFMNFTGSNLPLLAYKGDDTASVSFCTTFVLVLSAVLVIAVTSAFFYRKRRPCVFVIGTAPLVCIPLAAGRMGFFSNMIVYLSVLVTVIGTRHVRTDATDRRMRQKLSFILMLAGLLAGFGAYLILPPEKYEKNQNRVLQTKNTLMALSGWDIEDIFSWVKANFSDDALGYGGIGDKKEVAYSGKTLLKISGDVNPEYGLYLKGFVGDKYKNNQWTSLRQNKKYLKDWKKLKNRAVTTENWHVQLRNELGDEETSGVEQLWKTGKLRIRNLAFGYGNFLVPYLPADTFRYAKNGRVSIENPGIDYTYLYYLNYSIAERRDVLSNNYSFANHVFWEDNAAERQNLTDFAQKHYTRTPKSLQETCNAFLSHLEEAYPMPASGRRSLARLIREVKEYITEDTEYSLSPGKTPSGRDTVEYFLNEGKKGYCVYYATTAAVLLRSAGVPTRYVEGVYIPKEELRQCQDGNEIEVPDRDAHAWIEVYTDKYGFVPVEVTPGQGEDDSSFTNSQNTPPQGTGGGGAGDGNGSSGSPDKDDDDTPDDNPADGSGDGKEDEDTQDIPQEATPTPVVVPVEEDAMIFQDIEGNEDDLPNDSGLSPKTKKILWIIAEVAAAILAILLILEIQRRTRRYIFTRSIQRLRMKKRIRMVHHHLMLLLSSRGVNYNGQSVAEYTKEISIEMEMPFDKIYDYVSLVYRARFGPDDITEEDMKVFRLTYENIRRKAYEHAKVVKKLYYMYIMVL